MKVRSIVTIMLVAVAAGAPACRAELDLYQAAHALVDRGLAAYGKLSGYQASLHREVLLKDGRIKADDMFLRYDKPATVFLKYTRGSEQTLQVLSSEGHFGDKIMTRPPGLFFDFIPIQAMDPKDPRVTKAEGRPMREAGIGHMIEKFSKDLAEAEAAGQARVLFVGPAEGMPGVTRLEVELDLPGRAYPRTTVFFEDTDGLPIGIELGPAQGEPAEVYHYSQIQLDPAKNDPTFLKNIDRRILVDYYQKT